MKNLLQLFFAFCATFFVCLLGHGQITYCRHFEELRCEGDEYLRQGNYALALKKYLASITDCPRKSEDVQKAILGVFQKIDKLRERESQARLDAVRAKRDAEFSHQLSIARQRQIDSLKVVELERTLSDFEDRNVALQEKLKKWELSVVNQRLLESMWFYAGKYALGQKTTQDKREYFFIDRRGVPYQHLGTWDFAYPFDPIHGLALVNTGGTEYVIDTLGNQYRYTMLLKKINNDFEALNLDHRYLRAVPLKIWSQTHLRILILSHNNIQRLTWNLVQLRSLRMLDLSFNGLETVPPEIGALKELNHLDVRSNCLKNLPSAFGRLRNLQILYLAGNGLSSLPFEFGWLMQLRVLQLSMNQLSGLPNSFGNLVALRELYLDQNLMQSLPDEFGDLINLQRLDLSANHFETLPPELRSLVNLKYLNLRNNPLCDNPEQKATVLQQLSIWLPNCEVIL